MCTKLHQQGPAQGGKLPVSCGPPPADYHAVHGC